MTTPLQLDGTPDAEPRLLRLNLTASGGEMLRPVVVSDDVCLPSGRLSASPVPVAAPGPRPSDLCQGTEPAQPPKPASDHRSDPAKVTGLPTSREALMTVMEKVTPNLAAMILRAKAEKLEEGLLNSQTTDDVAWDEAADLKRRADALERESPLAQATANLTVLREDKLASEARLRPETAQALATLEVPLACISECPDVTPLLYEFTDGLRSLVADLDREAAEQHYWADHHFETIRLLMAVLGNHEGVDRMNNLRYAGLLVEDYRRLKALEGKR